MVILLFDSCTLSIIFFKSELSLNEQIDWIELQNMKAKISPHPVAGGVARQGDSSPFRRLELSSRNSLVLYEPSSRIGTDNYLIIADWR